MKIVLAIGNREIEEKIQVQEGIKVENHGEDLHDLKGLIQYFSNVDYLVINKDLSNDNDVLIDIAIEAQKKNIKIIILTGDFKSKKAKKEISRLAAEEVYAYMNIRCFHENEFIHLLNNYPEEFDFKLLAEPRVKTIEKEVIVEKEVEKEVVRLVRNQVISCFSADDAFISAEIATEVADMVAESTDYEVILIDFNNINPIVADILGVSRELKVSDKYENTKQTSLEALVNSIDRDALNSDVFKQLVQKDKKYKFDIITGLYDLFFDNKVEGIHYQKIIDMAQQIYDVVIVVTNPYLKNEATYYSLLKSTHILGITNNNYTAIYNLLANFKYIKPYLKDKEIRIVLANNSEYSLSSNKVSELFEDYEIASYLPLVSEHEKKDKALNNSKLYTKVAGKESREAYKNIFYSLGYEKPKEKKKLLSFFRR